mgnify:CR=1 FL=1
MLADLFSYPTYNDNTSPNEQAPFNKCVSRYWRLRFKQQGNIRMLFWIHKFIVFKMLLYHY